MPGGQPKRWCGAVTVSVCMSGVSGLREPPVTAQEWFAAHFPTREVFAPLAAFLLRVASEHEARLAAFQAESFGAALTIGVQVRRDIAPYILYLYIICDVYYY